MKGYHQYCPLAKALDLVGDRWTLLIVRELLIRGPSRYTDIRNGLPGIATNLLAERLRDLEEAGLLSREEAPPPIATTLFALTERGRALEPAVLQLASWGVPLMQAAGGADVLLPHWLALGLKLRLEGMSTGKPVTVQIIADQVPIIAELGDGDPRVAVGRAAESSVMLEGDALTLFALVNGEISFATAMRKGLRVTGDRSLAERMIMPRQRPRRTTEGRAGSRPSTKPRRVRPAAK